MALKDRPHKNLQKVEPLTVEKIFTHYDESIRDLDGRQLDQLSLVEAGATDAESIQNLINGLNSLFTALNASKLTKD